MTNSDPILYFQFEADFVDTLRCIPLSVRYKLDTCGVKLKLSHWHQFSLSDRHLCLTQPCDTSETIAAYTTMLQDLVIQYTGKPPSRLDIPSNPPWFDTEQIPSQVLEQAKQVDRHVSRDEWQALSSLQRFALVKLSQPGHENRNFRPAIDEFIMKT